MVRSLQPLLHLTAGANATRFASSAKTTHAPSVASAELIRWADQIVKRNQFPDILLAVAALRLAREFERAVKLLQEESEVPAEWRAAWENERAAVAWHQGQTKEALTSWQAQKESIPVLFNRGMACLFLNQRADARPALQKTVAHLPDDDAWHHLGRLYLALAEM
jgi:tetratricopeptide (TPR) repeat protein